MTNKNKEIINRMKKREALNRALEQYKKDIGVDFMKWIMGDEKEEKKMKFVQWKNGMIMLKEENKNYE